MIVQKQLKSLVYYVYHYTKKIKNIIEGKWKIKSLTL